MEQEFDNLHDINEYEESTRSYDTRYIAEIQHLGLGTFRVIKDMNSYILDMKVEEQFHKWDTQWGKIVEKNKLQSEKEASLNLAEERTLDAQKLQQYTDDILLFTLDIDDTIDWETLKDKKKFKIPNPKNELNNELNKLKTPYKPNLKKIPDEPLKANFQPKLSIIDKLFKSLAEKKTNQANNEFESLKTVWDKEKDEIENYNKNIEQEYQESLKNLENQKKEIIKKYDILENEWKQSEIDFYKAQEQSNLDVEKLKSQYLEHNPESIIQYCELVLNNSLYPDFLPKDFDLDYIKDSKMLLVEFVLPAPELYPTLTEVKYIATKKELKEYHLPATQVAKKYDTLIYNIALRTLHELFEADQANAIEIIVFNGWVKAINKATGKKENNCIVSIQAKKEEFIEINLSQIDPKACFKNLKGISSSKLSGITAIQPIIQINRNDKRFVSSYDVSNTLDESSNLAPMDWEDFEHLIREIFEKEFSSNGGEVKVTQASRDGGVDAVAFDPDPIRGGKIVIQAKRYTNTVGVSAVRDLYGTVMNEGATKGILVTTADYGPDAYEFVKNKPLTLINGANLLYLLEKYGHKAKIDIAEAKRLQKENQ